MTAEELLRALERAGSTDVEALKSFPLAIEEKRHDFLGGGVYLRVTIRNRHHPQLRHYVAAPGGNIYRIAAGGHELERMQKDLKPSIRDTDAALRYAQWVLEVTEGPTLWLLSSVKDVPFKAVAENDEQLAREVAEAKEMLARRISPPTARAQSDGFVVTQEAVHERKLVRYEVEISAQGHCHVKREALTGELPVVYVL